jgi:AraC-like DNA-binding protein
MTVIVHRPGASLHGLVRAITYQSGEQHQTSVEKILPDPAASMWVNLNRDEFRSFRRSGSGDADRVPGAILAGPRGHALVTEFEQGRTHVSVSFALGAARHFFATPLVAAQDELVPLAELWGRSGSCLREQLLAAAEPMAMIQVMERSLRQQLSNDHPCDRGITIAARALSGGTPVGEVSSALGLLPKTLRRRFTTQIGLTPKLFARVRRLQRVARHIDGHSIVDWAAVAAEHGYSDQPHLTDEFRDLLGVTPTAYLQSRINGPSHLRLPQAS